MTRPETNKKRDVLQFLSIFLFTFTWLEMTATGIVKSGLHLELGRSDLEQILYCFILTWRVSILFAYLFSKRLNSDFLIILFIHSFAFACAASLSLQGLFSRCSGQGLLSNRGVRASHCRGFSLFRAWALGCVGFSSCGTRAQ